MTRNNYWTSHSGHPRLSRRGVLRGGLAASAALSGVALVGCGDDNDQKTTPTARATGTVGTTPAVSGSPAAEQPKRGGTISFALNFGEAPNTFDPHATAHAARSYCGVGVASSRLLAPRTDPPDKYPPLTVEMASDAAEKWEQPDDTTITFTLRKGVKYHNIAPVSGREWTADDVVFSWNRQRDMKTNAAQLAGLTWTALDKNTLQVKLAKPDADVLITLGGPLTIVDLAKELVEQKKNDLTSGPVIGTGPWQYGEWRPNEVVRMSRNPDYFRQGMPYADTWEMYRIADNATELAAFRTKKLLSTQSVSSTQVKTLKSEIKDLQSAQYVQGCSWIWMNQTRAPGTDPRVRKAISKAVNRQAIIDTSEKEWDWGVGAPFPAPDWSLSADEIKKLMAPDPKEAKALLQAAGLNTWKTEIPFLSSPAAIAAMELVVGQLKEVGIEATLKPVDGQSVIAQIYRPNPITWDLAVAPMTPGNSITDWFRKWFSTEGANNGPRFSDPELDKMIEQQAVLTRDADARKRIVRQITQRLFQDGYGGAGGWFLGSTRSVAWWPDLRNFAPVGYGSSEYRQYMQAWRA